MTVLPMFPDEELSRCGVCGEWIKRHEVTVWDVEVGASHAHHYDPDDGDTSSP